ncbi:MAG: AbgT family transporter [Firmicutes bacterium]|nr:AbgT family transporter [Bacillota bacterium]
MYEKRKLKLKKFYFHPITMFLLFTLAIIVISPILSGLQMQATYNTINPNTNELEPTLVAVENMLSFDGMKFLIANATRNFISFAPLGTLLISLIGITIAEASGFIETLTKRHLSKLPKFTLTFLILFIATISSLINEVGYAILIPLIALIYFINGRNPILGIVTAFCGVAFGYGVTIFVGSMEISLMDYTKSAAMLIDDGIHIALTSNLIFIIAASIISSVVGTIIIEKVIAPKIGKYKKEEEFAQTEQYRIINLAEEEQKQIEKEKYEKKGLRSALIASIIIVIAFIYMLIPNLPYSGLLLDMKGKTYLAQLFGEQSYFQDGFTYLVSILLVITGIAYGISSKSIKSDKDLIEKIGRYFNKVSYLFILIFVVSQFIAVYKHTNIGIIISAWIANLLSHLQFSGIPLIITTLLLIGIANLFLTSPTTKWMIFSPVVVPMFMQSNISPQFAQIVMRVGNSITNGYTPIMASFVIYIGYLNLYNLNKNKPITIRKSLKMITPYFLLIAATWILLIVGWYIIGLPIGPGVNPTI